MINCLCCSLRPSRNENEESAINCLALRHKRITRQRRAWTVDENVCYQYIASLKKLLTAAFNHISIIFKLQCHPLHYFKTDLTNGKYNVSLI